MKSILEKEIIIYQQGIDSLLETVVSEKRDEYLSEGKKFDKNLVSKTALHRWTVNFIRHKMSNYDILLNGLSWVIEKDRRKEYSLIIKDRFLAKIAEIYPLLAEECKKQSSNAFGSLSVKRGWQ